MSSAFLRVRCCLHAFSFAPPCTWIGEVHGIIECILFFCTRSCLSLNHFYRASSSFIQFAYFHWVTEYLAMDMNSKDIPSILNQPYNLQTKCTTTATGAARPCNLNLTSFAALRSWDPDAKVALRLNDDDASNNERKGGRGEGRKEGRKEETPAS